MHYIKNKNSLNFYHTLLRHARNCAFVEFYVHRNIYELLKLYFIILSIPPVENKLLHIYMPNKT